MKRKGVIITLVGYLAFVAVISLGQITQLPGGGGGGAGPQGPPGATGATGPAGANGSAGPAGPSGAAGAAGAAGATGPAGPSGPAGTGGGGGITVEGAAPLGNNCLVTGAGTTVIRPVCTTSLDTAGNLTVNSLNVGNGTLAGEAFMRETAANGTDYWGWTTVDSLGATRRLILPNTTPTAGQTFILGAISGNDIPITFGSAGGSSTTIIKCGTWGKTTADTLATDAATYDTTVATNIGTTETEFAKKCTIPANSFVSGSYVKFQAFLALSTSATNVTHNFRVRVSNGTATGTLLLEGGSPTPQISLAYRPYTMGWSCWGTAAAGASVNVACSADDGRQSAPTGGAVTGWGTTINTTAAFQALVATNAPLVLTMTVQFGGVTAGNMAQMLGMRATVEP